MLGRAFAVKRADLCTVPSRDANSKLGLLQSYQPKGLSGDLAPPQGGSLPVTLARYTIVFAAALLVATCELAPLAGAATTEQAQAGKKTEKHVRAKEIKKEPKKEIKKEVRKDTKKEAGKDTKKPGHSAAAHKGTLHVALPTAPRRASGAARVTAVTGSARVDVPARTVTPLAPASSSTTSPLDLTAVKQAIELLHKGRGDEATNIEKTIIRSACAKARGMDHPAQRRQPQSISRAMPPSSPPTRAGRAS